MMTHSREFILLDPSGETNPAGPGDPMFAAYFPEEDRIGLVYRAQAYWDGEELAGKFYPSVEDPTPGFYAPGFKWRQCELTRLN